MARILADENFPQPAVEALRNLGHDVLTLLEAGVAGQAMADRDVLAMATAQGRVLITLNRKHFIQLHLAGETHAGLVVCTVDPDSRLLAARIHHVLPETEPTGQLFRVHRPPT